MGKTNKILLVLVVILLFVSITFIALFINTYKAAENNKAAFLKQCEKTMELEKELSKYENE